MWKHHRLSQHRRLISLVLATNVALFIYGFAAGHWNSVADIPLSASTNFVVVNISGAILLRQTHVINLLFRLVLLAPLHWPLRVRSSLGKILHFGGLHSGGSVAGTLWFGTLCYTLTSRFTSGSPAATALTPLPLLSDTSSVENFARISAATMGVTYALLALLVAIVVLALPPLRARYHNHFELSHRFGGWAALLLFWVQIVLLINDLRGQTGLAEALASSLGFWLLLVVTLSLIWPWLRLRRVLVEVQRPSSHAALVRFDYGVTPAPGVANAISLKPLREWHTFATIITPEKSGYRMVISRAGDWTGSFIDNSPDRLEYVEVWIRGAPTLGVGALAQLFKRVVWVVTGSGIGPAMSLLLSTNTPVHLVWSARNPRATYGAALVDEVLAADPDALLWDTEERGRPDLVKLAYAAVKTFDAEAVFCISNQKLTRQVVYALESRDIPAYGAIWDS